MAFAQFGPLTSLIESAAAAVGAGMVLGSFGLGLQGFLLQSSRQVLEARAVRGGYVGGMAGVVIMITDITLRYAL